MSVTVSWLIANIIVLVYLFAFEDPVKKWKQQEKKEASR